MSLSRMGLQDDYCSYVIFDINPMIQMYLMYLINFLPPLYLRKGQGLPHPRALLFPIETVIYYLSQIILNTLFRHSLYHKYHH